MSGAPAMIAIKRMTGSMGRVFANGLLHDNGYRF
jgi:hypothetical protein